MLFKLGLTVVVIAAVYLFYIVRKDTLPDDAISETVGETGTARDTGDGDDQSKRVGTRAVYRGNDLHLCVVACGDRLNETLVMIKSAVILSRKHIHVHIFAELSLHMDFKESLEQWPSTVISKFTFHLYPITFPDGKEDEWKKLFKPCASQRLFLPDVLKDVDSLLYVDTDILFLRPVDDVWAFFDEFNSTHLAALAPEHEDPAAGWYNRFARHPYYGPLGVNSGVMLMNLTRLRAFPWLQLVEQFYKEYKLRITWGDQDIINIIFHYHPDRLYVYPCEWNYRPDHCMYMSVCKRAEEHGVSVLHGNRGVYHNEKQPAFRAIYETFRDYSFQEDLQSGLVNRMRSNLDESVRSNCGQISDAFVKQLDKQVRKTSSNDEL